MSKADEDILVERVTITAKRNGKGKLRAEWFVELSNGKTETWFKTYNNMNDLRKEMAAHKTRCIERGMKPEQMHIQNFYS